LRRDRQNVDFRPYVTVQQPTLNGSTPVWVPAPRLADLENVVVGGIVNFGSTVVNGISAFIQHRTNQLQDLSRGNWQSIIQREGSFNAGLLFGAATSLAPNLKYLVDTKALETQIAGVPGFNQQSYDLGKQTGPLATQVAIWLLTEGVGAAVRGGMAARPALAELTGESPALLEQVASAMRSNSGPAYAEYVTTIRSGGRPSAQLVESAFQDLLQGSASNGRPPRWFVQLEEGRGINAPATTLPNTTRGWRVGDPINNLTARGTVPSWTAVRQRFWKNEAHFNLGNYSEANLGRMRQGLAPQRINPRTGQLESMELHHTPPQREGGLFDVQPVWPDAHALIDPFRVTGN
jgi:hypothetical protein